MGNTKLVQDVVVYFVTNTPKLISDMISSFEQKNYELLAQQAHQLSPQLHYMGAFEISQVVNDIEAAALSGGTVNGIEMFLKLTEAQCGILVEELRNDFNVNIN